MNWLAIAHAAGSKIQTGIPGPLDPQTTGILGFIQNAYLFALGIAGLLALGSIVYGAIQYSVSRGNASQLNDAWDRIIQAFIGILLLVGAGTLLSIINPGLLSLELPNLAPVTVRDFKQSFEEMTFEDGDTTPDTKVNPTNIPATVSCRTDAKKCTSLKALGFDCKVGTSNCTAHTQIATALQCAAQKVGVTAADIRITEAYPPTVTHQDPRHNNGCSVDLTLSRQYKQGGCDAIKAFVSAVNQCGGSALNEYAGDDRDGGNFSGCGVRPRYWTANNIHVNGCPRGTL